MMWLIDQSLIWFKKTQLNKFKLWRKKNNKPKRVLAWSLLVSLEYVQMLHIFSNSELM